MTFLKTVRSWETYKTKILSDAVNTQKGKHRIKKNFESFCMKNYNRSMEEVIQEMKLAEEEAVFDVLQEWINWIDKPQSIRTYFSYLNPYLYYRGIKISAMDIKQNLNFGMKHQEELHPLSEEEYRKIMDVASYKNKALYLLMGSSGMRPIEAINITKNDVEFDKERWVIHVPARFTKKKRAKTTFCSVEAMKFLKPILRGKNDTETWFNVHSTTGVDITFLRYCERVGLDKKYGTGRNQINPMSLRAWFRTKMDRHDPNLSLKWAGQHGANPSYDRMTVEEQLRKYLEFEADLIVSNAERNKKALEKQQKEINEFSNLKEDFAKYKKESYSEIEKLKWVNSIMDHYLQTGQMPEIKRNGKTIEMKFKSLKQIESESS